MHPTRQAVVPAPRGIFIALGSNLGDRRAHIEQALAELQQPGDIRVVICSRLHETAPVGGPPQGPFLNAAAELDTPLSPHDLLARMLQIEQLHGRQRDVANGPRTLDLDLLLYHNQRIREPGLIVPHPRMAMREFVLAPWREICDPARLRLFWPLIEQTSAESA